MYRRVSLVRDEGGTECIIELDGSEMLVGINGFIGELDGSDMRVGMGAYES